MWDVQRDVCQLRAKGLPATRVELSDSSRLAVGQEVFAIGNPKGLDLTMSAGLISSFRRDDKERLVLIQTSAAISGGSSGGGLFESEGLLVGLTTIGSVTGDAQNLNFAIPVDWVRELPERHARLASQTAAAPAPAPAPAQAPAAPSKPAPFGDYAAIDDIGKLPFSSERMRASYRVFLSQPMPRAFVISEGGAFEDGLESVRQQRRQPWRPELACAEAMRTASGRAPASSTRSTIASCIKPSSYVSN